MFKKYSGPQVKWFLSFAFFACISFLAVIAGQLPYSGGDTTGWTALSNLIASIVIGFIGYAGYVILVIVYLLKRNPPMPHRGAIVLSGVMLPVALLFLSLIVSML